MIKIKVTTISPKIPLVRQTPGKRGAWGDCKFFVDKPTEKVDWWFVLNGMKEKDATIVPKERTVLITGESEDMKLYNQKYLNQFGTIITSQRCIKHPNVLYVPQGHAWMVGHMGSRSGVRPEDYHKYFIPYDELKKLTSFKKEKVLSVFSSGKARTPGQRLRLDFIETLKKHFGEKIDVFGVNETYIRDKLDGIAPYKYHLSMENSSRDDYWTEKLADAFLGGAYPLYWGAPNIYEYFPQGSLTEINLKSFDEAIKTIENALSENLYEKNIDKITEARNLVLDKYNVFAIMSNLAEKNYEPKTAELVELKPESQRETFPVKVAKALQSNQAIYKLARYVFRKYRSKQI